MATKRVPRGGHPRVCVANVTGGTWRVETVMSLVALLVSSERWAGAVDVITRPGLYICDERNNTVHDYLRLFPDDAYYLSLDSDVWFEPDDLTTLVDFASSQPDACVISGAYPTARHGESWVVAGRECDDVTAWEPTMGPRKGVKPFTTDEFNALAKEHDGAPIPVDACGAGFMLVPRSILSHLRQVFPPPHPWFHEPIQEGLTPEDPNGLVTHEDFGFCGRVRSLGYPIYLHPGVRLRHVKTIALEV